MNDRKNKSIRRSAVAATSLAIAFGAIHLACSQDGGGNSGGPGDGGVFSGLKNVLNPAASVIGEKAHIDTRITGTVLAAAEYWEKISITPEVEDGMGQSVAVSLTNTYQLSDTATNRYVSLVGLTVVNASERPIGNWQFGVLETEDVNAFAGPNGYIFVTRGALNKMENEAQLAGVLAHEITHVLHHHGLEGVKTDATADFLKTLADLNINDATGLTQKLGTPAVTKVVKSGYGKGQENDADANAIKLMSAAGYDPAEYPKFLQKLEGAGGGIFATHPGRPERIAKTTAQIAALGNPSGKTLGERFVQYVNSYTR